MNFDWANPDYSPIFLERSKRIIQMQNNPSLVPALKEYYKNHIVEFINDWGCTFDPRLVTKGQEPTCPFILFPRQKEFVAWILERWKKGQRGLAEKSRDVGMTWLAAATVSSLFLFYPQFVGGFGSRKEDLVDRAEDPDTIFWKIRKFIELLPTQFKPEEFATPTSFKRHSQHLLITNPENGSVIKGEAGDEIGRGGRCSLYIVDEAAFLARPMLAEASLSANTDCRIDMSTVNGPGNAFYTNRKSLPPEQVFVFDWTEDPRKRRNPDTPPSSEPWFLKKQTELDASVFASEVLRDYGASISNTYIPTSLIFEAENTIPSKIHVPSSTPWRVGVDAAHMGDDESVIWRRRGRISLPVIAKRKFDVVQLAGLVEDTCRDLLVTAPVELIAIELDGPGIGVHDILKRGPFRSVVSGIHTGKKLGDGRNYNLRARLHRQAKEYLEEGGCHIPRDEVFKMQATSLLHDYKGGELLIESKKEYRMRLSSGRGFGTMGKGASGPSPDRFDAFVLTFTHSVGRPIAEEKAVIWLPRDRAYGY